MQSIYQNDNLSADPSFGIVREHKAFKHMARTMVDLEYNYTMQDPNSKQSLEYYSSFFLISIGLEFRPFSLGDTTLKAKYKDTQAYTNGLISNTVTFNLSQKTKLGSLSFNADFNTYKHSPISNTNEYKFTLTPSIAKRFWGLSMTPNYSLTLTDNVHPSSSKGSESTHEPSLTITKRWKSLSMNLNYAFNKKASKEESSSFTKHIFGFGMTYNL